MYICWKVWVNESHKPIMKVLKKWNINIWCNVPTRKRGEKLTLCLWCLVFLPRLNSLHRNQSMTHVWRNLWVPSGTFPFSCSGFWFWNLCSSLCGFFGCRLCRVDFTFPPACQLHLAPSVNQTSEDSSGVLSQMSHYQGWGFNQLNSSKAG